MIYIILASIFAGIGSYILRKGDLINFISGLIHLNFSNFKYFNYTIAGIILNLIAIFYGNQVLNLIQFLNFFKYI